MKKNDRLGDILSILEKKKSVTVEYLAKKIYTSPSTIRRDLTILESQGYLVRFHGGATIANYPTANLPIERRVVDMAEQKRLIGRAAAQLVSSGDTLFLDSSSTASAMIPFLNKYRNLKIITNSLLSLQQLQEMHFDVYSVGGRLYQNSFALIGQYAMETLAHFHINKMFFSTASLTSDGELCDTNEAETTIRQYAMQRSSQIYFLMDSSKIGASSMLQLCHLRDVTGVVSDADLPKIIEWKSDYPQFYPVL